MIRIILVLVLVFWKNLFNVGHQVAHADTGQLWFLPMNFVGITVVVTTWFFLFVFRVFVLQLLRGRTT